MQETENFNSSINSHHKHGEHHHHHHTQRYEPKVDRKCSPRRQRKLMGNIIFAIMSLVAMAVVAIAIYITIYGV